MSTPRRYERYYAPDDRDLLVTTRMTLRRRREWYAGPWSGDQGQTPHCVGYAWAHWLSSLPVRNWLDPDGLYAIGQRFDEWEGEQYDGTSVRGVAKALHHLGAITQYAWPQTIEETAFTLLEEGPVVAGINWYAGMDRPDAAGLIRATGRLRGGHAVLLMGIDLGKELVRIKNSWGANWGQGGFVSLPLADLARLIGEEGEICRAVERGLKVPK